MFLSSFSNSNFRVFFPALSLKSLLILFDEYHFSYTNDSFKMIRNKIFHKSLTSHETNWTILFLTFHLHDPKPKRNHQIASSRAKTISRQSQTCVNYRGNIICNRKNTGVNTSDLKILH